MHAKRKKKKQPYQKNDISVDGKARIAEQQEKGTRVKGK
jgi:hypothetical protein